MSISLLPSLPILLLLSLHTPTTTLRLHLTHIDATGNFTKLELLQRTALRSKHKTTKHTKTPIPIHSSEAEYLVDIKIGTPARPFSALFDTGSDLIWTQCSPCKHCFHQPIPLYHPSKSSTYSKLPCNSTLCQALDRSACKPDCLYHYEYADLSSTSGVLASERFTFGSETAQLGFGCGRSNPGDFSNSSGLIGFGRGQLSLISQIGAGEFSHCFTSFSDLKRSPLLIGSKSDISAVSKRQIQSTPLLKGPISTFYYLSLLGISVGGTRLRIPKDTFALKKDGSGGLIIDSGSTVTQIEEATYELLRKEFVRQVDLPLASASATAKSEFDLCFSLSKASVIPKTPKLVFHFKGANWELTRENYLFRDSGLLCLTIMRGSGISIFGNLQQQNTYVRYDLEKGKLSFAPARCDQL